LCGATELIKLACLIRTRNVGIAVRLRGEMNVIDVRVFAED